MSTEDFVQAEPGNRPLLIGATALCVAAIFVGVSVTAAPLSPRHGAAPQRSSAPVIAVAEYNVPAPSASATQEVLPPTF